MTDDSDSLTLYILLLEESEHDALAFEKIFRDSPLDCRITRCRGMEETVQVLRKDGLSFDALAAKILRLLTDEGLRRRIGQRAECWAEAYAWPVIADRIVALYDEVARG